jgi:hypothetical protein
MRKVKGRGGPEADLVIIELMLICAPDGVEKIISVADDTHGFVGVIAVAD